MSENKVAVVISGVDEFSSAFSSFESRIGSMRDSLLRFGEVAGLAAGAEFVNKISEGVEAMGRLSQKTGVAIGDLSSLAFAAQMDDVSIESMGKSIEKLSKALVGADLSAKGQSASKAIDQLGISVRDSDGKLRPLVEILGDIAEKFKNEIPAAERAGYAMTIFGKSGADMIPILMEGRDGLKELEEKAGQLGKTLGEEDVEQAKQFEDSLKLLKAATEGLAIQFVGGLLPALNASIEAFTATDGKMSGARVVGQALGDVIKTIALTFADLAYSTDLAIIKLESWAKVAAHPFEAGVRAGAGLRGVQSDVEDTQARITALNQEFLPLFNRILEPSQGKTVFAGLDGDAQDAKKGVDELGASVSAAQLQFEKFVEQISAMGDTTLQVLSKIRGHHDDVAMLDKDLASVGIRIKAIQEYLDANPGRFFPQLQQELIDLKAQAEATQKAIESASKPPDFKGQLPGGIGLGDIPIFDPSQTGELEKAAQRLAEIHNQLLALGDAFTHGLGDGMARFFTDMITGTKGAKAAFADFGKSIIQEMDRMIAKMIAVWIMEKILGWITSAAAGSVSAGAGGSVGAEAGDGMATSFSGGNGGSFVPIPLHAQGGFMGAGEPGIVGDAGPELWIPDTPGTVVPFSKMKPAGDGGGTLQVRLDITSDTDMKIARATAMMRDQAISTSVALVRERSLRSIG